MKQAVVIQVNAAYRSQGGFIGVGGPPASARATTLPQPAPHCVQEPRGLGAGGLCLGSCKGELFIQLGWVHASAVRPDLMGGNGMHRAQLLS